MLNGAIEQIGTPEDIYNRPASAFVADFVGFENIFAIENGRLRAGNGPIALAMHQQRVESRHSTVNGLVLPSWEEVETRHYESWEGPRLELDSARFSVAQCVERIVEAARLRRPR